MRGCPPLAPTLDIEITGVEALDVRYPTSRTLAGSDVMNEAPDYSAAYVDELHEHFVDPVRIRDGRYLVPEAPGYSIEMKPASLAEFAFPGGPAWRT